MAAAIVQQHLVASGIHHCIGAIGLVQQRDTALLAQRQVVVHRAQPLAGVVFSQGDAHGAPVAAGAFIGSKQ